MAQRLKRTQRNLLIIMSVLVAFYLFVTRLPWQAALSIAGAALVAFFSLAVWGRDYFVGQHHARRRAWPQAIERYQRFEQKLLRARWPHAALVLYLTVYTFDGVALVRNQIAQALINAGDLNAAAMWLRSALERDGHYALPYVNLGLIAALRNDEATARREMSRAVRLGYSPAVADRLMQQALEKARNRTS